MNWIMLIGSVAGVLALTGAAYLLGLGRDALISDADHARRLADEVDCGFRACDAIVDRAGHAALLRDAAHRHMLIRAHGNHFVARMIEPSFYGRLDCQFLTLTSNEHGFESTTLDLGDHAAAWAHGLRFIMKDSDG